ncbi:MAG TPA: hypothetical protein EYM91_00015 [Acidobacteria bacterium]|nr:hypothetical protein [Planctomycetaceae bacterium]HIN69619.1 hypothetical protein [Acidobacteriota bacterium]
MLPEKRFKTNVGVGIGSVLQLAGFFLVETVETAKVAGLVLILISLPVFVWGCMNYAEGKGYSKSVGLLGLGSIIGLIVLIVLPEEGSDSSVATWVRVAAVLCMIVGFALAAYGIAEDRKHYGSASPGPMPFVCMGLGSFLVIGSIVFLVGKRPPRNGQ